MTSLAADQESILYVRTVEIPDIPNLLALLPADGGLAWINGLATNQMGIVGWGEVTRSSFHGLAGVKLLVVHSMALSDLVGHNAGGPNNALLQKVTSRLHLPRLPLIRIQENQF